MTATAITAATIWTFTIWADFSKYVPECILTSFQE
jgi:hypothetical protein